VCHRNGWQCPARSSGANTYLCSPCQPPAVHRHSPLAGECITEAASCQQAQDVIITICSRCQQVLNVCQGDGLQPTGRMEFQTHVVTQCCVFALKCVGFW
jgi:hypothetical protein